MCSALLFHASEVSKKLPSDYEVVILYHLNKAMELTGADISVAVMSGDFVQRGEPAVIDKYTRASMALNSGVNLVVELPVNYAVSSAENFAAGALKVLDYIKADSIAFGSESGNIERLSKLAHILCDNEDTLYKEISKYTANGISNTKTLEAFAPGVLFFLCKLFNYINHSLYKLICHIN